AQGLLPGGPAAASRARVLRAPFPDGGDQRLVLLAAATRVLRAVVRGDTRGLRVRGERVALHHAHAAPQPHRETARQLLRLRHPQPARQARTLPLAVSADVPLPCGAARAVPAPAPAHDRAGARPRTTPR